MQKLLVTVSPLASMNSYKEYILLSLYIHNDRSG